MVARSHSAGVRVAIHVSLILLRTVGCCAGATKCHPADILITDDKQVFLEILGLYTCVGEAKLLSPNPSSHPQEDRAGYGWWKQGNRFNDSPGRSRLGCHCSQ